MLYDFSFKFHCCDVLAFWCEILLLRFTLALVYTPTLEFSCLEFSNISSYCSENWTVLLMLPPWGIPYWWLCLFIGLIILDLIDFEMEGFLAMFWSSFGKNFGLSGIELFNYVLLTLLERISGEFAYSCTGVSFEFDRGRVIFDPFLFSGVFTLSLLIIWEVGEFRSCTFSVLLDTKDWSMMVGSRRFFRLWYYYCNLRVTWLLPFLSLFWFGFSMQFSIISKSLFEKLESIVRIVEMPP